MNNKFYSHIGKGLIITLLALSFSISTYLLIDIFDIHVFASRDEQEDFLNEDIYLSATTNKQESSLDSCITIVSTDGLNRADIIHLLQQISDFEPKAIGLDLYFELPHPDSSLIVNALDSIPNIVCSAQYGYNHIDKSYYPIPQSFYDTIAGLSLIKGYTNFPSNNRIHRNFLTYVLTNQRDTLWSMATQLVKIYRPSVFHNIINQNVQEELIAFISKESTPVQFENITGIDFLSNPQDSKSKIHNKIVLLGDTNNDDDMLSTPLGEIPGVSLHAYATSTILSDNFIDKSSPIREWITAILICLILVMTNDILQNPRIICENIDNKKEEFIKRIANFTVRLIQFIAIVLLLIIGFRHFIYQHKIVDYTPTILMLGYSMLAYDLYMVVYAIIQLFKNKQKV